jgi:hypothetical protein
MRLGERSARVRPCGWRQLIAALAALAPLLAWGQTEGQAASAGPGRIVCNATFCEMTVAARTRPRIRVIVSALGAEEIHRLRKCTGVAKPCIVTVDGTAQDHPYRIMATDIHWQD